MAEKFMIGDIVKITYDYGIEYHLVYDVGYEGDTEIQSTIDTVVIFPVAEDLDEDIFFFNNKEDKEMILESTIVSNIFGDEENIIIKNINRTRKKNGYYEIPTIDDMRKWKKGIEKSSNKVYKNFPQVQDIIRYDELESVNQCLDAMNDLKTLHNMFGDEAYIQLEELVTKRLEVLSK